MPGLSIDLRAWACLVSLIAAFPSTEAAAAKLKGDAAATCSGLAGAMDNAVRIDSATMQAPSPIAVAEKAPTPAGRITPANPEFCKVLGRIEPVDPKAPPIRFQVNLPVEWNGRSLQYGGGGFNGVLITKLKLPSLSVTLGTFALYRGLTQVLLGDHSITDFPDWFTEIDKRYLGPTPIPLPLVIFLACAVVAGLILHRTVLGRWVNAIGTNEPACRYSGIAVDRIKVLLFTASGFMSGIAGLMMASRLTVARYDLGTGLELDVITAVVLGGTDIFGGRGTIFGTAIALFLITFLKAGMGLRNITAEHQLVVIGLLLIFSIVLPNLLQRRTR